MKNIQKIETALARMAELLRIDGSSDWASALEKFRREIATDPVAISAQIRGMYGGMGSLNDIVLYKNGQPLIAENDEFDTLRTELYDLCREIS